MAADGTVYRTAQRPLRYEAILLGLEVRLILVVPTEFTVVDVPNFDARLSAFSFAGVDPHKNPHIEVGLQTEKRDDVFAVSAGGGTDGVQQDPQCVFIEVVHFGPSRAIIVETLGQIRPAEDSCIGAGDTEQAAFFDGPYRGIQERNNRAIRIQIDDVKSSFAG